MNIFKRATLVFVFGMTLLFCANANAASSESLLFDAEFISTINKMITDMKQETMTALYQQAPHQEQMRSEMQMKYGSKAYLRAIFRPRQWARTQAMFHAGAFVRERMNEKSIPLFDPQNKN